ncbi:MAG: substrate-binding domain-containing protein [Fimbriimonadaceae bacterium]
MKGLLSFVLLASLFAVGCSGKSAEGDNPKATDSGSGGGKMKIAMIPKGTQHVFWKSVQAGAMKAGTELDVEVIWKGPVTENDKDGQIKVVEDFITKGVKGIGLAPLDDTALRIPVKESQDAGIPVLIFDSGLKDAETVSFVATDNKAAGKSGGMRLGELLKGKGKVIMMRYQEGSASTIEREEGFLEAMKTFPGIEVISSNQFAGPSVETAQTKAESLINANKKGDVFGVDGIFCSNESAAFGMLRALEGAQLAGKVRFVGFDSSDQLIKGLEDGHIDALVVQNPVQMGYLAVKNLVAHIKGETVEKRIDTGAMLVDKANMGKPEVLELIKPKF